MRSPALAALASRAAETLSRAVFDTPARRRPRPPALPAGWPGLYLGWGTEGPVHAGAEHHALVIGPPRAGKTTRVVVPNLVGHPGPVVVTSTKAYVLRSTLAERARRGRCWLWDPTATIEAPAGVEVLRWSPLVGCETWDQAVATAFALASAARPEQARSSLDGHWIERAQAVLAPLLHAAALSGAPLATVLSWLHRRELLQAMTLLESHGARLAADILTGVATTDTRELSGILSTADSILSAYRSEATLAAANNPNFSPGELPASADTIYLCTPGSAHHLHAPLVVALLDQIRTTTYRSHPAVPVLFALDEVANIAPLPDLPALAAEGGSQGLVVLACLQDLSQARARWQRAASGFLTLFSHTLVLPGVADTETLRQISDLAGHADIPVASASRANRLFAPTTTTVRPERRPRLPLDTIATGAPGQALLITRATPRRVAI